MPVPAAGNDVLRTQDAVAVDRVIIDGKTTRSQIEGMYGAPTETSFANAQNEIWTYGWGRAKNASGKLHPLRGLPGG